MDGISPIFYYVVAGYFIITLTIGLLAGRGNKTSEDHLVAGRSIGPLIGGAALAATQLSAGTFVGTGADQKAFEDLEKVEMRENRRWWTYATHAIIEWGLA